MNAESVGSQNRAGEVAVEPGRLHVLEEPFGSESVHDKGSLIEKAGQLNKTGCPSGYLRAVRLSDETFSVIQLHGASPRIHAHAHAGQSGRPWIA